jgi:L-rhamnose-H+ transport protein
VYKERELDEEKQKEVIAEFNFSKGVMVAVISGILSACFAFGLQAGKPIAEQALLHGTRDLFQNNAVLVWILWGGFLTNFIWTAALNIKNKSYTDYTNDDTPKRKNIFWAATGGVTWYFQFFFYGMGVTFLGERFDFASWSLHMAFIILFSSLWGIYFKEWKGVSKKTTWTLTAGLVTIVISTMMIGLSNLF